MRVSGAIVILVIAQGLAGCDDAHSPPTAPSPSANQPGPPSLIVFTDSASGFSTTDLRDAEDEIVQINTTGELILIAQHARLFGYRVTKNVEYLIEGKICPQGCAFAVRFGIKGGERRAYLTVDYGHENPGTLVDVEVGNGEALVVTQTDLFPPGSPTLSGVVTEATSTGLIPVEGVSVQRGVPGGWRTTTTDRAGLYEIRGLIDGVDEVGGRKEGYAAITSSVSIKGDTRFDIQIVRR
jgi:hypothetical protein